MDNQILNSYSKISNLNVSRETCNELESLISMIQEKNKEINIISRKLIEKDQIRERHIIDSAQIIDFVDLNCNTTSDIGTGGGMPGIVIAIIIKNLKREMKFVLYEKSYHKSLFLRDVSRQLNLDVEVIQDDIFSIKKINSGTIMARAFKPLPIVLDLVSKNFESYKNLIFFMGKNGDEVLKNTLKNWDFDYNQKKSLTSADSFLLNIKNIKKKILN